MTDTTFASLLFLLLIAGTSFLVWKQNFSVRTTILASAFLLGAALRLRYFHATPLPVRAYDFNGHLQYISYVLERWAVPPSGAGWEYHQPPLYYFFLATVMVAVQPVFGFLSISVVAGILSLLFSWGCLGVGLWTLHRVFPKLEEEYLVLASYLFVVLPGLIFFATRVSNDALFHLLSFVWFLFFFKEWNAPQRTRLIGLIVLTAALSLTKFTGLLYFVLLLLLVFLRPPSKEVRWKSALLTIGLFALLFAWHPIQRAQETHLLRMTTLGNAYMPKDDEMGPATFKELVTFSPFTVLKYPFNDIHFDRFGRRNFWEFAYRSVFFGQFKFERLMIPSISLVFFGLLLIPYAAYGSFLTLKKEQRHLPSLLTALVLFAGLLAYRLKFPQPTNEDVRYIVLAFLPLTILITLGIQRAPKTLALLGTAVASLFILSAFTFDVLL